MRDVDLHKIHYYIIYIITTKEEIAMTYAKNRPIIDVDSHVVELDDFLHNAASPEELEFITPMVGGQKGLPVTQEMVDHARELFHKRQSNPKTMAKFEANLMNHYKNSLTRLGAFDAKERSHTLDLFGYKEQWVLPTFAFHQVDYSVSKEALAVGSKVLNRALGRFCSEDKRLKAIGYVPLTLGPEKALEIFNEGLEAGCYSFAVDTNEPDPEARSFTHPDFDPVWAAFESNNAPVVCHIAINGRYDAVSPSFNRNDKPKLTLGGDAPLSLLAMSASSNSVELFLAAMIFDGVFEKHPKLKAISMEHGASWLPSWLRKIDFSAKTFAGLRALNEKPTETASRVIKVSPFAGEDIGWIIRNSAPGMVVYASDYPHIEGSGDPITKFLSTMDGCTQQEVDGFFHDNVANFTS